jgi:hypothetical protein
VAGLVPAILLMKAEVPHGRAQHQHDDVVVKLRAARPQCTNSFFGHIDYLTG